MRKWVGALSLVWLLWSDLSVTIKDNPLDTIMLRWLARVPPLPTDRSSPAATPPARSARRRWIGT